MFPSSTRRFLKEINMSNEEISTVAEKIVEVINFPTSKKAQITNFAQHRVAEQFNITKQQQEFVEFYKN